MLKPVLTPITALSLATLLLLGGALLGRGEAQASLIRQHSERSASEQLARAGFPWARLVIDDSVGRIEGQAPNAAERARALAAARDLLAPAMGWPGVFARLDDAIRIDVAAPSQPAVVQPLVHPLMQPLVQPLVQASTATALDCASRLSLAQGDDVVLFESGSSALTPASFALLQRLAPVLRECALRDGLGHAPALVVQGHTDRQGRPELNQRLSLRRAQTVVDVLIAAGAPAEQLRAEGLGASQPLAKEDSAEAHALNRRIEFQWASRDLAAG